MPVITRVNHSNAAENQSAQLQDFLASLVPYITNCAGNIMCEVLRQDVEFHQKSLANFPAEDMQSAMTLFAHPSSGAGYISIHQ